MKIKELLFILMIGVTKGQEPCGDISNCATCPNPPLMCEICNYGSVESLDGKQCLKCPSDCDDCRAGSSGKAECADCDPSYYIASADKTCKRCPGSCSECDEKKIGAECKTCASGFYKVEESITCQTCVGNCLQCNDAFTCEICRPGFYKDAMYQCYECPGGLTDCVSCTGSQKCDECVSGKFWDSAQSNCKSCMLHCDACVDAATCTTCSSGYVLNAAGDVCLSTSYCDESEDGKGCTSCQPGYKLTADKTCAACPTLNQNSCEQCMSDTRGHYWAQGECHYCIENCLSCTDDTSCLVCVGGMLPENNLCVDCAAATKDDPSRCDLCQGVYWDSAANAGAGACTSCVADRTTEDQCSDCNTSEMGYFWAPGQCNAVDCTQSSITIGECNACTSMFDVYWDGIACASVDCTLLATLSTNPDECEACDGNFWTPSQCAAPLCQGQLMDENTCTQCSQYYWDSSTTSCNAVDCTSSFVDTNQDACESCDGRVWNGASCDPAVDCSTVNLNNEPKCRACSKSQIVYWDGSACQSSNCAAAGDAAECFPCAGKYWDGSACSAIDETVCDGVLDSVVKCSSCQHFWNEADGTCQATACGSASELQEECEACDGQYWDASQSAGSECQTFDCSNNPQNAMECAACQHQNKVWDTTGNKCTAVDCSLTLSDKGSCMACDKFWLEGFCTDIGCDSPHLAADECNSCSTKYHDGTNCVDVNCNTASTSVTCNKCSDKYWDSSANNGAGACIDTPDCTINDFIVHNSERCYACGKSSQAVLYWDNSDGFCFDCPDDCLFCDENGCMVCKPGMFWDSTNRMCLDCKLNTPANEVTCLLCPGKYWDGTCKDCKIADCVSCPTPTTCDICETGKIYDSATKTCLDCFYGQEDCESCGRSTRGKYYTDLCYDCPVGCSECSATACTECAPNFYLDQGVCQTCVGAALSTENICDTCGGLTKYWKDGACTGCITDCLACTSGTSCDQCDFGRYYDSSSNTCAFCTTGCISCSSAAQCDICQSGKYFDEESGTCINLDSRCLYSENPGPCTTCNPGYYLEENVCLSCISGCDLCQDGETCEVCSSGKCKDEDKLCHTTTSHCSTCDKDGSTGDISCTSCDTGFQLEVCKVCKVAGCQKCEEDNTKCETCVPTMYYDTDTNTCKLCGASCLECKDGDSCDRCAYLHYWDSAETKCKRCGDDCQECTSADTCTKCMQDNMYKDGTGACQECMTGCAECSDDISCAQCAAGIFIDGQCKDCPAECFRCSDQNTCTECNLGYFLTSGACEACSVQFPNCIACEDSDANGVPECKMCGLNFALKDDQSECISCGISECSYCVDPAPYCETCDTGFIPTDDLSQCALSCYVCEGEGCGVVQGSNNSQNIQACPGVGVTHACWTVREVADESEAVTYKRQCRNETCSETTSKEGCSSASGKNKCEKCCDGNGCNTFLLTGQPDGGESIHTVTMASVAMGFLATLLLGGQININ